VQNNCRVAPAELPGVLTVSATPAPYTAQRLQCPPWTPNNGSTGPEEADRKWPGRQEPAASSRHTSRDGRGLAPLLDALLFRGCSG
jgi:hypothetical protein